MTHTGTRYHFEVVATNMNCLDVAKHFEQFYNMYLGDSVDVMNMSPNTFHVTYSFNAARHKLIEDLVDRVEVALILEKNKENTHGMEMLGELKMVGVSREIFECSPYDYIQM